jgi:hypothetical protein
MRNKVPHVGTSRMSREYYRPSCGEVVIRRSSYRVTALTPRIKDARYVKPYLQETQKHIVKLNYPEALRILEEKRG